MPAWWRISTPIRSTISLCNFRCRRGLHWFLSPSSIPIALNICPVCASNTSSFVKASPICYSTYRLPFCSAARHSPSTRNCTRSSTKMAKTMNSASRNASGNSLNSSPKASTPPCRCSHTSRRSNSSAVKAHVTIGSNHSASRNPTSRQCSTRTPRLCHGRG